MTLQVGPGESPCTFRKQLFLGSNNKLLKSELTVAQGVRRRQRHYNVLRSNPWSHHIGIRKTNSTDTPTTVRQLRDTVPLSASLALAQHNSFLRRGHLLIACTTWAYGYIARRRECQPYKSGIPPTTENAQYSPQVSFRRHPNVVINTFSIYHPYSTEWSRPAPKSLAKSGQHVNEMTLI